MGNHILGVQNQKKEKYMHIHVRICIHIYIYMHTYVCVYAGVYLYIYIYSGRRNIQNPCVCVYIYIHNMVVIHGRLPAVVWRPHQFACQSVGVCAPPAQLLPHSFPITVPRIPSTISSLPFLLLEYLLYAIRLIFREDR